MQISRGDEYSQLWEITPPSIPFIVGKRVVIHILPWITGVGTIKTADYSTYGRRLKSVIVGLGCGLGWMPALSEEQYH